MDIADGLIQYLMLVALLTFHEFGHAWTAWKCGDDTARLQGRVSLNPLVHIDPIGTVLFPLLMIFLPTGASRFMIGWAKPVPVNPYNLRNKNFDDILVTMAGPGMNLILAVLLVAAARAGLVFHLFGLADYCVQAAQLEPVALLFQPHPHTAAGWFAPLAHRHRHDLGDLHELRPRRFHPRDHCVANPAGAHHARPGGLRNLGIAGKYFRSSVSVKQFTS